MPPPPPQNNMGWGQWLQQEGNLVGENELANVNNLANMAIANAVANGIMQQPDQPQDSVSVSSETSAFYRAQGTPITLELPLPAVPTDRSTSDRALVSSNQVQRFDSDDQIREMANRLGLHQVFSPAPSVDMLLKELALMAQVALNLLPMKNPLPARS